jgi:ABC-type nitrate/sulfonate/bicarbonate transport system substrate-binding protein
MCNPRKVFQSIARLVLFATLVIAATASGQEKVKFSVGVGTKTLGTNALFLGTKKGFFDDVGLEVQPVLLRGNESPQRRIR